MNILKVLTKKRIIGNIGEDAAARYLIKRGYKILERNYVMHGHEIDIIAENDEYICFTEVKTRTSGHEDPRDIRPAASVDKRKREAIISAARFYAAANKGKNKKFRFDVAEVYLTEEQKTEKINYMESAFSL